MSSTTLPSTDPEKQLAMEKELSPSSMSSNASSTTAPESVPVPVGPLDWDGPDDVDNPYNWPMTTRWIGTVIPGLLCTVVTFASSAYTPGVYEVSTEFNISLTTTLLGLSLYVLGLGLGPMFSAPLSELHGRKLVYLFNLPPFLLFTIGAGFAQSPQALIICRLFAGFFGGPALAVSAGSFVDIWPLKTSGLAVAIQALATFLGPALGPVVGGAVVEKAGWRWSLWVCAIFGGICLLPVLFMPETYKPIILTRRAVARGLPLPPRPPPKEGLKLILTVTLLRPTMMLLRESIVQCVALYSSFAFAVLFGFFEAYPFAFSVHYGFGLSETGLCFLGIAAGLVAGCGIYLVQDRLCYVPAARKAHGDPAPEIRLVPAMIGSFLMPVGLFVFAWAAEKRVHWIVPVAAGAPFGAGLVLIFLTAVMYLLEVYPPLVAASAMASLGLLRYVLAMAFPLFTVPMFQRLGIGWATSCFGFIAVALMPIPWVFARWGEKIRAMSKFDARTM